MKSLVEKALVVAGKEVGVREINHNHGKRVEEYLASCGLGGGAPWCAAFVNFCIEEAARQLKTSEPWHRTAGCDEIKAWARRNDILFERPEPGDVFLHFSRPDDASHTGFVVSVDGGQFDTIEGNTNIGGSREGIGVFKRTRSNSNAYKFVRWDRLVKVDDCDEPRYTLKISEHDLGPVTMSGNTALFPVRKWGEFLGFKVEWNNEKQVALFDGREVHAAVVVIGATGYAPVRDLAAAAGLRVDVDEANRVLKVTRPVTL
jgi:hypothetical protein